MSSSRPAPRTRAEAWRARGAHFSWSPAGEGAAPVNVFHVELGDAGAPVLALVHGFPTCSIDWFEVAERLSPGYRVCMLDFPGFGFSDKPRGWGYSLRRDAQLLDHYLTQIVGARSVVMVAHDRGDSVALIHAANGAAGRAHAAVEHLVLSNANLFLPLSNLTDAQRLMLHSPELLGQLTPELLAAGMGAVTFTPPRTPEDPAVQALAATFAHDDGVAVLHETIQYLVERSVDETAWLQSLAATALPTTLIWGVYDTVSPIRVANHVWHEHLMFKPGRNAFYLIPGANHYVQNDRPDAFVQTLSHALDPPDDAPPGALSEALDAPILVDRSHTELPDAAQLIAQRAAVPPQQP
ncbi:MAG TPA: alpha/beta hydrolase [Solirubrobacteraceae bacterium]|nr:alpha/beta hydrolase [Solirubrobacteraceae bacterium]